MADLGDGVDIFMGTGKVTPRLEEMFVSAWKGRETENCVWWQGEWWSWERLNKLALECEAVLKESGFGEGQRLAVMLPNCPMIFALSVACWRLGGAVAPLNARTGLLNIIDTLKLLDANAVLLPEDGYTKYRESDVENAWGAVCCPTDKAPEPWDGRQGQPESADIAVIFSTSGTTGNPKAVICLHSNIYCNLTIIDGHVPGLLDKKSIFLNVLPNFHTLGYNTAGMLPLMSGLAQAIVPSFVPVENTIRTIKEAKVNVIVAVPTVIAFILGLLDKKDEFIEGVRFAVVGGDKLNTAMEPRCKKHLGVGIIEGYGLTECCPVISVQHDQETKKLGTVGTAFSNYEIQVRDREGNVIGSHEEGVLWVKGPCVVPGYFRDEATTRERFVDGWLNTGDVVRIDNDGYITIIDRATDIIIVSGFNVYPQEVEDVLREHPAVHDAVAVGEKNSIAGELVKAFIILEDGASVTAKEITSFCRERLAHYKVPRKIGFVTEFPLSPAGKILRRELRNKKIER